MGFVKDIGQSAMIFWEKNSTKVLTVIAVGGAIVTPILASRATLKAKDIIDEYKENQENLPDADDENGEDTGKERVCDPKPWYKDAETWKKLVPIYGPTAVSGAVTIGSIIFCDRIHVGKEAGLAAMSLAWEQRYKALEKKVAQKIGDEAVKDIKKELKKEQKPDQKKSSEGKPQKKSGDVKENLLKEFWVYDPITKQKFKTSLNRIMWTNSLVNERYTKGHVVKWNHIIKWLGGKASPKGDCIGYDPMNEEFVEYIDFNYYGFLGYFWFDISTEMHTDDAANVKMNGVSIPTLTVNEEPWDLVPFATRK